jgi:hypothetical protein
MDLEQFVSESLAQIIRGVEATRDEASNVGATINPSFTPYDTGAVVEGRQTSGRSVLFSPSTSMWRSW